MSGQRPAAFAWRPGSAYSVRMDLSGASLVGANLARADLAYADLRGADLSYSDLSGAVIGGALLTAARLDHAVWVDGRVCRPGSRGSCVLP